MDAPQPIMHQDVRELGNIEVIDVTSMFHHSMTWQECMIEYKSQYSVDACHELLLPPDIVQFLTLARTVNTNTRSLKQHHHGSIC